MAGSTFLSTACCSTNSPRCRWFPSRTIKGGCSRRSGSRRCYTVFPKISIRFRRSGEGGYLAFLGRISPEKRPDRAIEIAKRAGVPLKIAAKVDKVDQTYFDEQIRPLIKGPGVEFIGEVNDSEKQAFLGGASALLFPIDWPEPFGLVQIEAMACGTPVVAWRRGSVPEVIDEGVSGFMVEDIDEAVAAVHKARSLSRQAVRDRFEQRFTIERVAHDYVRVYNSLAAEPILLAYGGAPRRERRTAAASGASDAGSPCNRRLCARPSRRHRG